MVESFADHVLLGHQVDAQWQEWVSAGPVRVDGSTVRVGGGRDRLGDTAGSTVLVCVTCGVYDMPAPSERWTVVYDA